MLKSDGTITLSFSEMVQFIECPYKHYLQYEKGYYKERVDNEFGSFGTAIHNAIEHLHQYGDIEHSHSMFNDEIIKKWTSDKFEDMDSFLEVGQIAISKYFLSGIIDRDAHAYTEFEVLYNVKDNIYFKGKVDLITNRKSENKINIIDLKTTKNDWSDYKRNDLQTKAQLYLYKIFLSKILNTSMDNFICTFVLIKYNTQEIEEFVLDNNPDDIAKVEELFNSVVDALYYKKGNKNLKFKNDYSCKFCMFRGREELCSNTDQDGFQLIRENQLTHVYEKTVDDGTNNKLVIPWRDIKYDMEVKDWREDMLNMINKKH